MLDYDFIFVLNLNSNLNSLGKEFSGKYSLEFQQQTYKLQQ